MVNKSRHGLLKKTQESIKIIQKNEGSYGDLNPHDVFIKILVHEQKMANGLLLTKKSNDASAHSQHRTSVIDRGFTFELKKDAQCDIGMFRN